MKSFYGKPDRKNKVDDGYICSEIPAWMQDSQINSLGEEIDTLERDVDNGFIPSEDMFAAKQALGDFKERFDDIVRSKPRYSQSEETVLYKELGELDDKVADTLYSRYDQLKGKGSIARPQREADLNDFPCIEVNEEIAKICNLVGRDDRGRVSRNQADKARKLLHAYFGTDRASRESIRPENNASRKRPMVGYTNERFRKRYDEIYGKRPIPNDKPDSVESRIDTIRKTMSSLENSENGQQTGQTVQTATTNVPETDEKPLVKCAEESCDYEGTANQIRGHKTKHTREKRKLEKA